jgi:hypothetical protein
MKIFPLAYTENEVEQIINIGVSTLQKSRKAPYTNIKNGKCPPFYKDGGSVLYRWIDIMEFIENRDIIGKPKAEYVNEQNVQPNRTMNSPAAPFINRLNF